MKCNHCGNPAHGTNATFCSTCGGLLNISENNRKPSAGQTPILWENDPAIIPLATTITEVIFHPDVFFKDLVASRHGTVRAWLFGLVVGSIGLLSSWLWTAVTIKINPFPFSFLNATRELSSAYTLIATPFLLSFQLFVSAAYVTVMMRTSGKSRQAGFRATFRVICYAESSMLLQVVPVIGTLLGSVLWVYALLTGLHHLNGISRVRAFFLLTLPILIFGTIVLMILAAGLTGGLIAGTSYLQQMMDLFNLK